MKTLRHHRRIISGLMLVVVCQWQLLQPLQGATLLWDANSGSTGAQDGSGTWSAAGTTWWNPITGTNVSLTAADLAVIGSGGVGGTIGLSGNQSALGLVFGQTTTTGYTLNAGAATTLTLGASGVTSLQGAQAVTLGDANLSLVLGAAQSWMNRSTAALTVGGAINNGGFALTLGGLAGLTGTGSYTLNGNLSGAGGLNLSGPGTTTVTSASGYTGATTVVNGATLSLSGAAGALTGTSGVTLANGTLTLTNATGEQAVDRVVNAASITSFGGTINWTNPSGDNTANWAETLGTLTLTRGQTNIISTNAVLSGRTQVLTLGTGSLTHPANNTSTIAFGGPSLGGSTNVNNIMVTGQAQTAANQIIGPWATFGSSASSQTDYATYNRSAGTANTRGIQGAGIAATAETTWTTAANSYTFSGGQTLTATRTINALRYTGGAATLVINTGINLATYGLLNGGTGSLVIANATSGTGVVTTPTGGDNTLFLIAGTSAGTINIGSSTVAANIADNGSPVNVVKSGVGTVTFGSSLAGSGANSYTGVTTINGGILASGSAVTATFNGGAAGWLGQSSNAASNLVINGGTLRYAGPTAGTTDRLFTLGEAGGTVENNASSNGTLTFSNTGSLVMTGTGDRTLTLSNIGSGAYTFTPVITDPTGGGKTTLVTTAAGTGHVILNASANTFTGGIVIQNRVLRLTAAGSAGSNEIFFGSGTTPQLDLRPPTVTATSYGNNINVGTNTGNISLSNTASGNGTTLTLGNLSIGSGQLTISHGGNLATNNAHSLTLGTVTLAGNPTFFISNGNGTAAPLVTFGALNDGGTPRTITVTGGAGSTSGPRLLLGTTAEVFTPGTNILFNPTNANLAIRLTTANAFGSATANGLITFQNTGALQLLQNTNTAFNLNVVTGDAAATLTVGGTSNQNARSHSAGTLSMGSNTVTVTQAFANSNQAHSLTFGATTFTGNTTLTLNNTNGTGIGSLILGALNDGGVARSLVKNGTGTLQLTAAATSMIAGTTLTNTAGIVQIGNNSGLGSATVVLGNGSTSGQLLIANTFNLAASSAVTYAGGFTSPLGSAVILGPTTGAGTISAPITINAVTAADTGHFAGNGGTLNITGAITTGGSSNGEVVIRAGNVGLNNATGNSYTSLRVNAGATTLGATNAIPTTANVALAELAAASITVGAGLSQTIDAGATWTLGGTGPTLENNVGTLATGTGSLVLNGTLANNTGSLATQLVTGTLSFGGSSGTFNIDSGHATSDMTVSAAVGSGTLVKEGAGILTLSGAKTLTGLTVNNGTVVGGYGTSGTQAITLGASGSLQLVNSATETLTLGATAGALNVAGGARIGFELNGVGVSDNLIVPAGGTSVTAGTVTLDFYNLGSLGVGTYTLLTAPSGLLGGGSTSYNVGSAPLGFNYTLNASDTQVLLTTTAYSPRFWTGSQATTSWSTMNAGPLSNWSTIAAGTTNSTDVPSSSHTVIFSAANAVGPTISTTLDAAFAIDAMQFLAAPTGVTAVNVAAGSGGTLTIAPATSSAGIYVDTNAGTATLAAGLPMSVSANQTWNVVGGGANGSALVVASDVAFTNNVTKSGAGALTLSGSNTGAGNLTLSSGTLNLNSSGALGTGAFTINGGTTINNSSGSSITLAAAAPITLNGNFTFTGSNNLTFGAGAVTLPTNVSITTAAAVLTLPGNIGESGGARSLTKLGAGTLTLTGNNTFSGGVNNNAGQLNLGSAGALGTGTLVLAGGAIDNTSGAALTNTNNNAITLNANTTFVGSNSLNLGTGSVSLGSGAGATRTLTVNASTLTIAGNISNGSVGNALTKTGVGTLTLSGANTFTGNLTTTGGTLNITGSWTGNTTTTTLVYGSTAATTIVNNSGNVTIRAMTGAVVAGAVSIYNQTGGTTTITPSSGNAQYVAAGTSGTYGYFNLTGGTFNVSGAGQRFDNAGVANTAAASVIGITYIGGNSFLDNRGGDWMINAYGHGHMTIADTAVVDRTGAAQTFGLVMDNNTSGAAYGVLNLAGGTFIAGAQPIRFGNSGTVGTNNRGFINLAKGVLSVGGAMSSSAVSGNEQYQNFVGGTLRTSAAVNWIPANTAVISYFSTLFGAVDNSAVSGAPSFDGGLVADTVGGSLTLSNVIAGASTSSGVTQANLSLSGGSGYVGAPEVLFSSAGVVTGGTPATGYALISGGQVTGIVITNPGTYTAGTVPTVSLNGGGGTGASVTASALNTANGVGGITKISANSLILSNAANSFSGPVTINAGAVQVSGANTLANIGANSGIGTGNATSNATNAASLVLNGGTFSMAALGASASTDRLFTVTELGGAIDQAVTTSGQVVSFTNTNAIAQSGTGNRTLTLGGLNPVAATNTFAPQLSDAGVGSALTVQKTGISAWQLTNASNSYTGGTNIAQGVLAFSSGALGSTGNITFTGASTLRWATGVTDDLSSRLVLNDGITGTIDTNGNNVSFASGVGTSGGTTGVLLKVGTGSLTLNAAATHTGGVTLNAGGLNLGHAGALGTGTFSITGATAVLDNTSGAAMTLSTNPAQAWNANFAFTGSNNLNLGTGNVTLNAARTVTVNAGTLTVGGIIDDGASSFALTKSGAGTLYLKGANTFGSNSTITITGGTLMLDGAAGLGDATNDISVTTAASTLRFTGSASFGSGQYLRIANVATTIEVDSGAMVEFAGAATGANTNGINTNGGSGGAGASLIKTGAGTLRISGNNGFFDGDGGWVVSAGTLSLAGNNTSVLGDNSPTTVALRLNGGTVIYDTDTPNIGGSTQTIVQANNSTIINNLATAGPGIVQALNALSVTGNFALNIQGGTNVTSGTAAFVAGATTLTGNATFNITDPTNGGTTSLSLGAVTGGANSITLTGNGDLLQTGAIATSAADSLTLGSGYTGLATLSQTNTYSGNTVISGGTLSFAAATNLGDASSTNDITIGNATLSYTGSTTADLTASRQINLASGTSSTIEVSSATGLLQATGGISTSSAANLSKTGLGTLSITGALNLSGGNLTVSAGTLQSGLNATGIGAVSVANGGTLNLYDTATVNAAISTLSLANGSALGFDLNGTGINDALTLSGAATISPIVALNFNNLGGLAGGNTYDLITVGSGTLNAADFVLGVAPSGFNFGFTTVNSATTLRLTTSTLSLRYWQGDVDGSWSTNNTGATNWASDAAGTTDLGALPGSSDTLVFSTSNATGTTLTTTLDGSRTADSLQFTASPGTVTAVAVNQGSGGTLTLSPASANNGIAVASNAGNISIAAPIETGANQTWEVIGGGANGSSLSVSGDVTFTNKMTKSGAGTLTLSGSNSAAGGVQLAAGQLNLNSATAIGTGTFTIDAGTTLTNGSAGALTLSTNNAQTWNGSFTFGGTQSLNLGTGAVTMTNNLTTTVSNTLTVGGAIDDGGATYALTKAGAGTLVLNGANSYDGLTTVSAGALTLAGDNSAATGGVTLATGAVLNVNHAAALGTGTLTINGGTLNNTSGSDVVVTTANAQQWNAGFSFTGASSLNLGTGTITLNAAPTVNIAANTLTLGGQVQGGFGLIKAGPGTLTLAGLSTTPANNYLGTTTLDGGTVAITADAVMTGGLTFGPGNTSTNVSTLDLSSASATFNGTMLVQTNTASANTINIGNGESLTNTGNVTIGTAGTTATLNRLNVSGAGSWIVSGAGLTFRLGGSGASSSTNVLDMGGLAVFNANLGTTGAFRLGSSEGGTASDTNTVTLAAASTITAGTIDIGGSTTHAGNNSLLLGSGVTTFNADVISIGSQTTGTSAFRSNGDIAFAGAGGSLVIRAANGTGAATLNVVNTTAGTGNGIVGSLALAGHSADVLVSTLTVDARGGATITTGASSGSLTFDAGTFTAATTVLSNRSGTTFTTGSTTATATFGGGTVSLGAVTMSQNSVTTTNSSGNATATLTFNGAGINSLASLAMGNNTVSGTSATSGTVATLNHAGTAATTIAGSLIMGINAANAAVTTSTNASSTINVSGGSLSVGGDLIMATTTSNLNNSATGSINLTGGTLTVAGNIAYANGIGTESNTLTLAGGTLDMTDGSIGASGAAITFNAQSGTLKSVTEINGGAGLTKTTAGILILEGTNSYSGGTSISAGTLQVGSGSTTGTLGVGTVSNSGTLSFNRSNAYTVSNNITGTGALIQAGSGTTTLSGTNTYSGKTTVSGGTLAIASDDKLGAVPGSAVADQLTLNGGSLEVSATASLSANRGITLGASHGTIRSAAGTTTTVNSVISGSGNLTKSGDGTLALITAGTYTGTTTVSAGTLRLASTGATGSGGLTVQSNATLVGTGTVAGSSATFDSGSSLHAGDDTVAGTFGTLTFNPASVGTYTFSTGSTINLGLSTPTAFDALFGGYEVGSDGFNAYIDNITGVGNHDRLVFNGGAGSTFTMSGSLVVSATSFTPQIGQVFNLLDWASLVGTNWGGFSLGSLQRDGSSDNGSQFDLPDLSSSPGLFWDVSRLTISGNIAIVPEPSRALLLLLGCLGLAVRRRR